MPRVLGLKWGTGSTSGAQGSGIGWCLIDTSIKNSKIIRRGEKMITGDPALAALDTATRHPGVPIDLKRYATAAAFHGSLPQREGQTLEEHHELIERTAALLRSHDIDVSIDVIGG